MSMTPLEQWQAHVRECPQCEAESLAGLTDDAPLDPTLLCPIGKELYEKEWGAL